MEWRSYHGHGVAWMPQTFTMACSDGAMVTCSDIGGCWCATWTMQHADGTRSMRQKRGPTPGDALDALWLQGQKIGAVVRASL